MKIKIKVVKGEQLEVEAEPSVLVADLIKAAIEAAQPKLAPASTMKLVYLGRILDEKATFDQYKFKEKDFLVAIAFKPKPPPPASDDAAAAVEAASTAPTSNAVDAEAQAGDAPALQDPEVAGPAEGGGAANGGEEGATAPATPETPGSLAELQNDPQFQQLVQMVRQNPQMLHVLAHEHPQLIQLIMQNREEFAQLLAGTAGGNGAGEAGQGTGGGQSGFQLTPEEIEAIERLQQLGFPRAAAVQVYLACDKNEELAANMLFDNGEDLIGDD